MKLPMMYTRNLWQRRKVSFSHFCLTVIFLLFSIPGRPLNTLTPSDQEVSSMPNIK